MASFYTTIFFLAFVTSTDTFFSSVLAEEHRPIGLFGATRTYYEVRFLSLRKTLRPISLGFERATLSSKLTRQICQPFISPACQQQFSETDYNDLNYHQDSPPIALASRGGGQVKTKKPKVKKEKSNHHHHHHDNILSDSRHCFVELDDIAALTLRDVGVIFDYTIKSTGPDFKEEEFFSDKAPEVKSVIGPMEKATAKARGTRRSPPRTGQDEAISGDIEAFNFCAAMRILSEWRILRQVPEGKEYKQYAVGMKLARKDVLQNIGKIEKAAYAWMDHREAAQASEDMKSPTLRDILQFEKDRGIHEKLPKLKEGTGCMGILWNRRGLDFHANCFEKLVQVPKKYATSNAAVLAAYNEIFGEYHGWALKKVFMHSFQSAPDIDLVYRCMNPRRLKEVKENAGQATTEQLSMNNKMQEQSSPQNPLERIRWEFIRMIDAGGQCCHSPRLAERFGLPVKNMPTCSRIAEPSLGESLQGEALDRYVTEKMRKDAHEQIASYLAVTKPILKDLADLFEEFNMNDPTKA